MEVLNASLIFRQKPEREGNDWSDFTSTLYRKLDAERLFPQEKATLDAAVTPTSEVKTL
jgi:hypothetical protein